MWWCNLHTITVLSMKAQLKLDPVLCFCCMIVLRSDDNQQPSRDVSSICVQSQQHAFESHSLLRVCPPQACLIHLLQCLWFKQGSDMTHQLPVYCWNDPHQMGAVRPVCLPLLCWDSPACLLRTEHKLNPLAWVCPNKTWVSNSFWSQATSVLWLT